MADVQVHGLAPRGHHLTSLLLHTAATVLLFQFLRALTGKLWRSALAAVLFAAHPLGVESVAWVAERKNVLSGLFWVLSLGAYLRYVRRPGLWRYLAVVLAFTTGLMAKPVLVTLPLVLVLLDWWPLGRIALPGRIAARCAAPASRVLLEKLPLVVVAAAAGSLAWLAQSRGGALEALELPAGARVANALLAGAAYLGKTLWPAGLAVFYPHPGASVSWTKALASGLLAIAATALVARATRTPHLAFGWLWFLVTLAPVSGLVQAGWQGMADRYTYIPVIGIFVAAAWTIGHFTPPAGGHGSAAPPRCGVRTAVPALLAVIALAAISRVQTGFWENTVVLFEHARNVTGENWLAEYSLGNDLWRRGLIREARDRYRAAIRLNPGFANAYNNLGALLLKDGDPEDAVPLLKQAGRLSPRDPLVRYNLGLALEKTDPEAAAASYLEALRLDPEYSAARVRLEIALRKGRTPAK